MSIFSLKKEIWYYLAEVSMSQRECVLCYLGKIFFILVLWLAEFWIILIKPGEYIMDEKATHPLLLGGNVCSPFSHRGHKGRKAWTLLHTERMAHRLEGSKHERRVEKRYISFLLLKTRTLQLFPPLLQDGFPKAMSSPAKPASEMTKCTTIAALF